MQEDMVMVPHGFPRRSATQRRIIPRPSMWRTDRRSWVIASLNSPSRSAGTRRSGSAAGRWWPLTSWLFLERRDEMGLSFPVSVWYQWSARRGEFDRRSYNERCMSIWRCVFFSGEGGVGLWNDGRKLTPLVHPEGNRSESLILRKGIAPFRPAVIIRLDAGWAWNGTETKRDCQRLS